jgi:hypothetical protein
MAVARSTGPLGDSGIIASATLAMGVGSGSTREGAEANFWLGKRSGSSLTCFQEFSEGTQINCECVIFPWEIPARTSVLGNSAVSDSVPLTCKMSRSMGTGRSSGISRTGFQVFSWATQISCEWVIFPSEIAARTASLGSSAVSASVPFTCKMTRVSGISWIIM